MADLSTLADAVLANPAPVVLLDACTVLDIVRAAFPARPSSSDIIVDAKRLEMAARATPRRVWLVATSTAILEIREHLDTTVGELRRALQRYELEGERVDAAGQALVAGYLPSTPQQNALRAKLPDELRYRVNELLGATEVLVDDDRGCRDRAHDRSIAKIPPAHKKESRKDCEMYEHYLAFASLLRAAGATEKRVFVSSNTEDFDVKQASLEAELRAHDLKWLPDLHAAAGFAGVR